MAKWRPNFQLSKESISLDTITWSFFIFVWEENSTESGWEAGEGHEDWYNDNGNDIGEICSYMCWSRSSQTAHITGANSRTSSKCGVWGSPSCLFSCSQYGHKAFECPSTAVTGAAPPPGFFVPQPNLVEPLVRRSRPLHMELGWWSSQVDSDCQEVEGKVELPTVTNVQLMFRDLTRILEGWRM